MQENCQNKYQFQIEDKEITVYPCTVFDRPIIYLNTFGTEGEQVYQILRESGDLNFTFVTVTGLLWEQDMTPWATAPISKNSTACTGGADNYLRLFTEEIVQRVEEKIRGTISFRGLAGYSLSGLFAVYSLYRTKIFSRVASISGSLWFPNFKEYVFSHEMKISPDCLYFSLGNKECKTRNPYLKMVREYTKAISDFYTQKGIDTIFCLNPGNHYSDTAKKTAAGIRWIANR
jgi:hypothetical protein